VTASNHLRIGLLLACGLVSARATGTQTVSYPFLGVKLFHQVETSPRPLNINVVEIDLTAPGLGFQVTPKGPEPRPIGTNPGFSGQPMETIRQTPRQYANSAGAQIAINASFYSAQSFDGVLWANNLGLTASNGTAYSPWEAPPNTDNNFDDALNITAANQAQIVKMPSSVPTGYETLPSSVSLYNTVTGQDKLLQSGVVLAPSSGLDPRTAFGLTAGNAKLLLMTVDGRQPGFSEGVTLVELANLMASYGATNAIGMDGGGSTQMAMNYYGDGLSAQLVNVPSEAERLVGTSLAVFALPNGDYNQNGLIDTADYVVWRRTLGQPSTYNAWRQRFGSSAGTGSALEVSGGVPEPASLALVGWLFLGLLALSRPARHSHSAADRPSNSPA
jgi:hypothetical protein